MNKIVLNFGLLVFCLSIVFFSQRGLTAPAVLLRGFIIFVVVTVMCSVLVLVFIRAINKSAAEKAQSIDDHIIGTSNND